MYYEWLVLNNVNKIKKITNLFIKSNLKYKPNLTLNTYFIIPVKFICVINLKIEFDHYYIILKLFELC